MMASKSVFNVCFCKLKIIFQSSALPLTLGRSDPNGLTPLEMLEKNFGLEDVHVLSVQHHYMAPHV